MFFFLCSSRLFVIFMKSGEMIITNDRYAMTEAENNSMYAVQMVLVIRKLHKADMGGYKCISKNSIGDAEGTIRLYGEFIDDAIFDRLFTLSLKEELVLEI